MAVMPGIAAVHQLCAQHTGCCLRALTVQPCVHVASILIPGVIPGVTGCAPFLGRVHSRSRGPCVVWPGCQEEGEDIRSLCDDRPCAVTAQWESSVQVAKRVC